MSTDGRTHKPTPLVIAGVVVGIALVIATGLLLREHGPGNMYAGFLVGAGAALLGGAVMWWRVTRSPGRTSTFERAWTQTGDERDDAVLTHALAVLGLVALPLTGAAAIAIGLGAVVEMVLALLLMGEILVGVTAFVVVARRN